MPKNEAGFSLIDTAMVLLILSVMVSALFVVRQVVINGNTSDLAEEFNEVRSAVDTYMDRFGVLPGDDSTGLIRWPESTVAGNCDGQIQGAWDAALETRDVGEKDAEEARLVWMHLRKAHLYPGEFEGVEALRQPKNSVGGLIGVQEANFGLNGTVICMSGISPDAAHVLDSQLDDGVAATGIVRGNQLAHSAEGSEAYSGTKNYSLCRKL